MAQGKLKSIKRVTPPEHDVYFSRSVDKAFEILALLGSAPSPLSLPEVAARTKLTKSFAYRLLRTLEVLGHVQRISENRYTVPADESYSVKKLTTDLLQAAHEPMQQLHMQFRETVSLAAMLGNRIEVLEVLESPYLIRMTNHVGRILPPFASSLGKVITAFQEPEVQQRLLASYGFWRITESTITDEFQLRDAFAVIREECLAEDNEESIADAFCLGAPITDRLERVVAGISISMPKSRIAGNQALRAAMESALRDVSKVVSAALREPH